MSRLHFDSLKLITFCALNIIMQRKRIDSINDKFIHILKSKAIDSNLVPLKNQPLKESVTELNRPPSSKSYTKDLNQQKPVDPWMVAGQMLSVVFVPSSSLLSTSDELSRSEETQEESSEVSTLFVACCSSF